MATYITKTQVSATDRKKFTFSAWIKRSKLSSGSQNIYEINNLQSFQFSKR